MQKFLLVVLALLAFIFEFSLGGGGFRCYVGNSADPDNIGTIYVPPRAEPRCYRYEKPTCSGCVIQCNTSGHLCNCYGGCDEISIQNATYTWYYGTESAGVCSDIPNHWEYWKWYRSAICCSTDLCNYPINNAPSKTVSFLGLVIVTIQTTLFVM